MEIVQTISKDINMKFGLEKCARICLKMHVGSTFENDIKELDPRKAYKRVLTYSIRMRNKS